MSKKYARVLAMSLALVMLLALCAGCGNSSEPAPSKEPEKETSEPAESGPVRTPIDIHWAAGSSSGACYITGTVMGGVLSELYNGYTVTPEVTTGGVENAKMLVAGDAQFISIQGDDAISVNNNTRGWVDVPEATDILRYVGCANGTKMNLIARLDDDSINSFEDVKGKRVGVLAGSTYNYGWAYLLEAYGMTEADFASVDVMSRPDLCNAIQDGSIDFIFDITPDNQPAHQEAAFAIGGYKLLSIPAETRAKLMELNLAYQDVVIAADCYNGNDEAETCGLYNIWCTTKDADYQMIYDILTCFYDEYDTFKAAHPLAGNASDEEVLNNQVVPWHPAAEQFYKDRGILK